MNRRIIYFALMLVLGIVAFGRQPEVTAGPAPGRSTSVSLGALTPAQQRQLRTTATVRAVRRVGKAVIAITSTKTIIRDPQFGHRFGAVYINPRQIISVTSLGSGVIIDSKGHAITNEHVISQATSITVQMADGRRFPARVVGAAPAYDLALIKITSKTQLPHAILGRSRSLMAGEPTIAIGNPLGLDQTVSRGVISTPNRTISSRVIIAVKRRGQAWRQNLRRGDVLVAIGRHLVRNVRDVNRLVRGLTSGHQFVMKIQRKNKVYDVVMWC